MMIKNCLKTISSFRLQPCSGPLVRIGDQTVIDLPIPSTQSFLFSQNCQQVLWICQLILGGPVYSLHGVRPAAPLAWIQSFEVEPELDQAEVLDHPLVEASVAARRQLKHMACGLKPKE